MPYNSRIKSIQKIEYEVYSMKENKGIMYVAVIATGSYDDYHESNEFCSLDKTLVQNWVNRYNRIVKDNERRSHLYFEYDKFNEEVKPPYLAFFLHYEDPKATVREIPIR